MVRCTLPQTSGRGLVLNMLRAIILSGLIGLGSAPVMAEEARLELVDPDGFTERFSGNTKVSGQFLTGLAFDSGAASLDLSTVRLIYPADASGMVCVRLTTDDGRYWAANLYAASQSYDTPPVIALPTSYDAQLREYGVDGLLLLASQADDCAETDGKLLMPAIFGTRDPGAPLLAFVNVSQGRPSAWLERDGARVGEGVCERPEGGAKVTYSHFCRLSMPADLLHATYELKVAVKGLTGKSVEQTYAINLE